MVNMKTQTIIELVLENILCGIRLHSQTFLKV